MVRAAAALALSAVLASYAAATPPKSEAPKISTDGVPLGDRPVLVFFVRDSGIKPKKGDIVAYEALRDHLLYLDLPCPLPVEGAGNMLRSADPIGVGCWGPLLNGGIESVDRFGHVYQDPTAIGYSYEIATFHIASKTFTIIEEDAMRLQHKLTGPSQDQKF